MPAHRKNKQSTDAVTDITPIAYPCQRCDRVFTRTTDLKRHTETVHQGLRKYVCEECGKTFSQKGGLQTHLNTHSGATPYECRVNCGHPAFTDASSRSRHEYETHAPPGFHCPEGCAKFKRKDALKNHVMAYHKEKFHLYTEAQLSNRMTREIFNKYYLEPARLAAERRRLQATSAPSGSGVISLAYHTPPPEALTGSQQATFPPVQHGAHSPYPMVPTPNHYSNAPSPAIPDDFASYFSGSGANSQVPSLSSTPLMLSGRNTPFQSSPLAGPQQLPGSPAPLPEFPRASPNRQVPLSHLLRLRQALGQSPAGFYSNPELHQPAISPWDAHFHPFPQAQASPAATLHSAFAEQSPSMQPQSSSASPMMAQTGDFSAPFVGNGMTMGAMHVQGLGLDMPMDPSVL